MAQSQKKVRTKTSKATTERKSKAPRTPTASPNRATSTRKANQDLETQSSPEMTIVRPKGKLGQLLTMIEEEQGATLEELGVALNWQPHTARAAISRLRKRGVGIALTAEGDRTAYRITV